MDDEHPFVAEVRANPFDDAPRLIYADYLEEAGDPQGELIRLQVELSHLRPGDAGKVALETREQELLAEHAESWLAPLRELGVTGVSARCFQRGLIERARMSAEQYVQHGSEVCRLAPALYCLELKQALPWLISTDLSTSTLPPQVTSLDLSANQLTPDAMQSLTAAPWLGQLEELNLRFNRLADDGIRPLAQALLDRLHALDLSFNRLGPVSGRLLARAGWISNLKSLRLGGNQLGRDGLRQLAEIAQMPLLETLELAGNNLGSAAVRSLLSAGWIGNLRLLNLRDNGLNNEAYDALLRNGTLSGELQLDLRNNGNVPANVAKRFANVQV